MHSPFRTFLVAALLFALVGLTPGLEQPVLAGSAPANRFTQVNLSPFDTILPAAQSSTVTGARTVNAPYFPVADVTAEKFPEMAIFWFGKVTSTENYTDVRVGYNDTALYVMASVFDRRVWYDPRHDPTKLLNYDSMTLYLNTGGTASYPNSKTFRFDAQMSWFEERAYYQLAYQGTGTTWKRNDAIAFLSERGYSGGQFNNSGENRGWAMKFIIPFASLGFAERPADLSSWGMGLAMHDRDGKVGVVGMRHKYWPESLSGSKPGTWGRVVFGLPAYTPPAVSSAGGTVTIRHKLDGQTVADSGVGGNVGYLCNDSAMWTTWGAKNFGKNNSVIIQNQSDLSDWPCFAKYYVTFPLTKVPKGKVVTSARLVMYEMGGSDWNRALPSLIQVSTVKASWSETTINWNNAPMAQENVAQTWVDPVPHAINPDEWPGWPYEWDVTRAVAEAAKAGLPLRLVLYEADNAMHSGKQFNTSNVEDWNAAGRPTLIVEWGNP